MCKSVIGLLNTQTNPTDRDGIVIGYRDGPYYSDLHRFFFFPQIEIL